MPSKAQQPPTVLLDESVLGMDVFLRDLGWSVAKVTDIVGPAPKDDAVIEVARKGNYILVTPDRKLARRCNLLGIRVVEVAIEDLARRVHESLQRMLGLTSAGGEQRRP